MRITLNDCPEELQEVVTTNLKKFPAEEILSVQKWESTPYKDKSIVDVSYRVFTQYGNLFKVYSISKSSNPNYSDSQVFINKMIAGEISEIVKLSDWFK